MLISFNGQQPDYETFYRDNYNRVLNYVYKKISHREDAEDLTAEVFVYCFRHYSEYDPAKGKLSTWLYLITNSRIKNYYRDHVISEGYDEIAETLQDMGIDLDRGIYLEQLRDCLMHAISRLPERQQTIIKMRYFENRSGEEIAQHLGITPGNVRVLLSRAIDKLSAFDAVHWGDYVPDG